ncbi:unnamed protein product [Darwinula stevensoni]|uniref:Uncharacterized protein n=1 Tax=Darwinula stevensoni TaxID=69355 RepID=A0A7R9ACI7_9CRUS|nr:unnamed protein product [Darwinula stevensoni]CAG0900234.1 unnamed protein product [Darwinula stevensoni]
MKNREEEDPDTLLIEGCDLLYVTSDFFSPPWTIKHFNLSNIAALHLDQGIYDLSNTTITIHNVSLSNRMEMEDYRNASHFKADRIHMTNVELRNPSNIHLEARESDTSGFRLSGSTTFNYLKIKTHRLLMQNFSFHDMGSVTLEGETVSLIDAELQYEHGFFLVRGDSVTISRLTKNSDRSIFRLKGKNATMTESRLPDSRVLHFSVINGFDFRNNILGFCPRDVSWRKQVLSCHENTWAPNCTCPKDAISQAITGQPLRIVLLLAFVMLIITREE